MPEPERNAPRKTFNQYRDLLEAVLDSQKVNNIDIAIHVN